MNPRLTVGCVPRRPPRQLPRSRSAWARARRASTGREGADLDILGATEAQADREILWIWAARAVYRAVAHNGHRLPGGAATCSLPAQQRPAAHSPDGTQG
ncbi:hypothetical protein PV721_13470 [Streptomyces sp. MB09-01]|uniref:hypothetical protein n=1 Tax=Streptomyces sp. MB09-01 TaxID=3028666 RepID=UPI0029B2AD6A|nr:hypothetical protein [Streptomyces sp. MB09-01]MDX3535368.1 hypothetical protein [Streptomyces sp. MB09-01]